MRRNFTFLVLLILGVEMSHAQTEIDYRFTASVEKRTVFMSILIKAGSICQGISIERSTDSLQFTEIGSIAGTCGSTTSDVPYTFTDNSPVANTVNYYRLRFGENGFSTVLSALYVELQNNYKLYPNPAATMTTLQFSNDMHDKFSLTLRDISGHLLYHEEEINDKQINLEVRNFLPGIYFFQLRAANGQTLSGKLVVVH